MRKQRQEPRDASPNTMAAAATAYQDSHVRAGHLDQHFDAPPSLMFGDTSFLNFDPPNPDQVLPHDHHNPQAILNTSDYDFLNNFFTNPDSLNQIHLNPYDFAPDDKSSSNIFAAASFDPHAGANGTINPSTLAPSQASLHKSHMNTGHMPFASQSGPMGPPQQQQQQRHNNMNAADYTAASTIHNLKSTSAPHVSQHNTPNNFAGASSWGSFMMPNAPPPNIEMSFPGANGQSGGPGQTRHQSFTHGRNVMYFQGIPSQVPSPQLHRHYSADSSNQYVQGQQQHQQQQQQEQLRWHGSQSTSSNLPHAHSHPPTVSFGSDPSFVSTHFHSSTPVEHLDKAGNLVNIPYAAQVAEAAMAQSSMSRSAAPASGAQQNGSHMQSRRLTSGRGDKEPARKRRKSQADLDDDDEYMPGAAQDISRASNVDDSGDETAVDGKSSSKRRKSFIARPSQTAMSPKPVEDDAAKRGIKKSRETLTELQKRQHHIQSEKKRREIINQGYNDLNVLVPCLNGGKSGLSRSECLQESASYIEALIRGSSHIMEQLNLSEADLVIALRPPVKAESEAAAYGT